MAATIKDIARKLDLSISTVSYALNDGPKPVSKDVYRRVQRAAKELGYRPNRLAKSLVTRRTHTIGVVPIDVTTDMLSAPYVYLALNGIFNTAARLRQDVLVFTGHDRNLQREIVDDMLDGRVDGIVFINPTPGSSALRQLSESDLPYVVVAAGDGQSFSYIVDNQAGSFLALEHLYRLGHRHIAHVAGKPSLGDAAIRRDAYIEFTGRMGLDVPEEYFFRGDYGRGSGFAAGLHFAEMRSRPTAIFCANDDMALGVVEALRLKNVDVPGQISVVGFDDDPNGRSCQPPLTTVRQPIQSMASEALEQLILRIDTGESQTGKVFDPELIVRDSTAIPPEKSSQ